MQVHDIKIDEVVGNVCEGRCARRTNCSSHLLDIRAQQIAEIVVVHARNVELASSLGGLMSELRSSDELTQADPDLQLRVDPARSLGLRHAVDSRFIGHAYRD